jgi:hypothetical protein
MENIYKKQDGSYVLVSDGNPVCAANFYKNRAAEENDPNCDYFFSNIEDTTVPSRPTYNQLHRKCVTISEAIIALQRTYSLIIGLSRGGLLPGIIMSHMLNSPFKPLEYSSVVGKGDKTNSNIIPLWISENVAPQRILLVDDIADSGNTLREVHDILSNNNFIVDSFTLFYKRTSVFAPTFVGYTIPDNFGWIYFPFEKQS